MTSEQNKNKYIFGFSLIEKIGPARFKKIKKHFPNLEKAWQSDLTGFIDAGIDKKTAEKIITTKSKINLEQALEQIERENIKIICHPEFSSGYNKILKQAQNDKETESSNLYPKQLAETKSAPFVLFCKGNTELLNKKQLAVVGTRKPTVYGKQIIEKIIPQICNAGLVITSGLAMGIDSLAHKTALENNSPTIAVLGSGLGDEIIKRSFFRNLAQEMLDKDNLIISEYPPNFQANKFTFPARNRIISGLSLGILVIEAGERSGTLITSRYALDQNREIFAVPGNIFSSQSVGTNKLLKQGAALITSSDDILEAFNFITSPSIQNKKEIKFEDDLEEKIYNKLSFEPLYIDKIALLCKLDSSVVSAKLSLMELKGTARNVEGGRFIKN
jgi:DNA processing protein